MLTFFTTAKPFVGHSGIIQRNALLSWKQLDPQVEIILFGQDEGSAEIADELGLIHEPRVERTKAGTIRIDYMFARAEILARQQVLCYCNCDILLFTDFMSAIRRISRAYKDFLAIGRRWNVELSEAVDFRNRLWVQKLRDQAEEKNDRQDEWFIDYFAFSRGFFPPEIPPLSVGRGYWDNWMVWKARQTGKPVFDVSGAAMALHQNHDYGHHPLGKAGVYSGEGAEENLRLAGGIKHLRSISDATHLVTGKTIRGNWERHWMKFDRTAPSLARFLRFRVWNGTRIMLMNVTRPLRSRLGIRGETSATRLQK
jgi:hypothetical protein